jgi:hypothetical protein
MQKLIIKHIHFYRTNNTRPPTHTHTLIKQRMPLCPRGRCKSMVKFIVEFIILYNLSHYIAYIIEYYYLMGNCLTSNNNKTNNNLDKVVLPTSF